VAEAYNEALQQVYTEVVQVQRLMDVCKTGFDLNVFLRTRAKNLIAQITGSAYAGAVLAKANGDTHPHIDLMHKLKRLRDDFCKTGNKPVYMVAATATLNDMARYLPQTKEELSQISGFGPTRVKQYGKAFLEIIQAYCAENGVQGNMENIGQKRIRKPKEVEGTPKIPSKEISYQLFKEGKTVDQIAAERNMTVGTVESHLSEYVSSGELDIEALLPPDKVEMIALALSEANADTLTPAKELLGDKASFNDIRLVKNWMKKRLEAKA
jgi:hypothetical protein